MRYNLFQVGSRVRVTSYSPFRGLRGTIRTVDTISGDLEEPFCFYQITLEGAHIQEPIWFEYDEVELVTMHEEEVSHASTVPKKTANEDSNLKG